MVRIRGNEFELNVLVHYPVVERASGVYTARFICGGNRDNDIPNSILCSTVVSLLSGTRLACNIVNLQRLLLLVFRFQISRYAGYHYPYF